MAYLNVFGYFFILSIFAFWNNRRRRHFSSSFICCLKQSRRKTDLKVSYSTVDHSCDSLQAAKNLPSVSPNLNTIHDSCIIVPKRHCELPPVPDVALVQSLPSYAEWPADHSSELGSTWHRAVTFVDSDARPYSFCGPPSDSDQVYASVGGNQTVGGSRRISGVAVTSKESTKLRRKRSNSEPDQLNRTNCSELRSKTAWETLFSAENLDKGTGEDTYSGSVVPYYSIIPPSCTQKNEPSEKSSSPFYQAETIQLGDENKMAVYAKVCGTNELGTSSYVKENGLTSLKTGDCLKPNSYSPCHTGPVIPSRAYRKSEVDRLLGQHRRGQAVSKNSQSFYNHLSTYSADGKSVIATGKHLVDSHDSVSVGSRPNSNLQTEERVINRQNIPVVRSPANILTPECSQVYASLSVDHVEGKYTNITVRESIASLRERNALPPFLLDPRFRPAGLLNATNSENLSRCGQTLNEAIYEGVYWYPEEPTSTTNNRSGDSYFSSLVSPSFSPHRAASGLNNGEPSDGGSDAYTEIPDLPHLCITNRNLPIRLPCHSGIPVSGQIADFQTELRKFPRFSAPTRCGTTITESFALQTSNEAPGQPDETLKQMFLEMQAFHYVDSESIEDNFRPYYLLLLAT